MRTDLKGLAEWDAHRGCWTPVWGKQDEVAAKLGPTWTYDEYYGSFFGQDPPKPAPATQPDYCGCYMCQGGGSCGGAMCSVEVPLTIDALEQAAKVWEQETAGKPKVSVKPRYWVVEMKHGERWVAEEATRSNGVRQVESKALLADEGSEALPSDVLEMMGLPSEAAFEESRTRDSAAARARHLAREPFLCPFGVDDFEGSPWRSVVLSLPVGKPADCECTTNYALFAIQDGVLKLWLREDLRQSPFIRFWDGRPLSKGDAWLRPMIGGAGWLGEGGAELRCMLDSSGALHLALPTSAEMDQHIIWWREETAEEWMGPEEEYEHRVMPWRTAENLAEPLADNGWELATEVRTLTTYCRRRRG